MNERLAAAALSLLGAPFRFHGRDPATGLDCVGLVGEAMRRAGHRPVLPEGYALRSTSVAPLLVFAHRSGLEPVTEAGSIWLVQVHSIQNHLLVVAPGGAVHAHAGLRRVVFLPEPVNWPIKMRWQIAAERT